MSVKKHTNYFQVTGKRLAGWGQHNPGKGATLILFFIFWVYLFISNTPSTYYDDFLYWHLAEKYWTNGEFRFLAFDNSLRGYLFPLVLSALVWVLRYLHWGASDLVRPFGAAMAAALFGVVLPGLWRAVQPTAQPAVPLGRRLLLGALGFAFWRGYFNFSLSDFPAVLALAGGLWAMLRGRTVGSGVLAGLCVAAAVNFRPVFGAALPVVAVLGMWPLAGLPAARVWGHRLALVLGLGMGLAPQVVINHVHFGANSPFVLTTPPGQPSLYLLQLQWGLLYQKYETNVGTDYSQGGMFFLDASGQQVWHDSNLASLENYGQYATIVQAAPLAVAATWLRHLFNGLDLQYATPYISRVYASTWGLAWLNYTVLLGGLGVLAHRARQWPGWRTGGPALLVLAVVVLPCLAALPVAVECRFLLPLHLALTTALALGAQPGQAWRRSTQRQRLLVLGVYVGVLVSCFTVSSYAQRSLQYGPRYIFKWLRTAVNP